VTRTLQHFINAADNPRQWMNTGDNLLLVARFIYDSKLAEGFGPLPKGYTGLPFEFVNPFLRLAGFALENMFKGLRVYQLKKLGKPVVIIKGPKKNKKTKKNKRGAHLDRAELRIHDLTELARKTGILPLLDHNTQALLARLSVITEWAGRYPVESSLVTTLQTSH
jgi:hypothetical protein